MTDGLAMTGPAAEEPLEERLVAELPGLRAFLRRLAGSVRADVDDLAQEAVARALKYRAAFDPTRELGPWLRATALRAFLDQRERARHAPSELCEHAASPERAIERVDQRGELDRALARLSAVEREVVLLFHARGQSIAEIAARLSMPAGTVKSHLHRARRRLAGLDGGAGPRKEAQ